MNLLLDLISGICWSLAYTDANGIGVRHRTWCFPSLAICQNFSWELFAVVTRLYQGNAGGAAFFVQLVWLVLDIGILVTWLRFDTQRAYSGIRKMSQIIAVAAVLYTTTVVWGQWETTAFTINAIMSGAFLLRAIRSPGIWMSRFIAIMKMIGTLAATILNGVILYNAVILWLGGICFILDIYYIAHFSKLKQACR